MLITLYAYCYFYLLIGTTDIQLASKMITVSMTPTIFFSVHNIGTSQAKCALGSDRFNFPVSSFFLNNRTGRGDMSTWRAKVEIAVEYI